MDEKKEIITPDEDEKEEDKQTVPLSRFQEVYREKKELEEKISSLETKKADGTITSDEKKELEAKNYLKNLFKEVSKEEQEETKKAERIELESFNKEIEEIITLNPDVKKADFLKFIEVEADKYDIKSVNGAMSLYRKLEDVSKSASEKTKKDISSKPKLPTHEGGGGETYDDKGKSLYQIANEAKKELNK